MEQEIYSNEVLVTIHIQVLQTDGTISKVIVDTLSVFS